MFPFNLEVDQASAVAAELVQTLQLPPSELDYIALNLLQFRQEYEAYRSANPNGEFHLQVERDTQSRLSLSDSYALGLKQPVQTEGENAVTAPSSSLDSSPSQDENTSQDTLVVMCWL